MQQRNIDSLQILRAFAAIFVIITHSGMTIPGYNIGDLGVIGVDLFFVLSGFLMTYTFKESRVGLSFLKSRVLRIYPIYLAISAPMILVSFMKWDDSSKLSNLFHNITLIPALHTSYDRSNYVNWTLMYEMYFYVFFAIASFLFKKKIKSSLACSAIIVLLMFIVKTRFEIGYSGWFDTSAINILGNTIVLDFVVGSLWGCVYNKITFQTPKLMAYAMSTFIIAMSLFLIRHNMKGGIDYQSSLFLNSSIPSFFVVFIISLTHSGKSKIEKGLIYLGGASYSMYLSHLYIFLLANTEHASNLLKTVITKLHIENTYFLSVFLMLVAISAGIAAHELIEKPLNNKLMKKKKPLLINDDLSVKI